MKARITYLRTVVSPEGLPPEDRPEIAIAGRSNAGKSSLLNAMFGQKEADTSATPGKTRGLNFFDVSGKYWIVDLPGYGYAARSGGEMLGWGPLIEGYMGTRGALAGVILVTDSQREWSEDEAQVLKFCAARSLSVMVVLNKIDRLNQGGRAQLKRSLTVRGLKDLNFVSARTGEGVRELEERMFREWVQPRLG